MVVIRLKRLGRRHRPFFRLNAMEKRAPRDGRVLEELGYYDPVAPEDKQLVLKNDRIEHWLKAGAQPSDTARTLIRRAGITVKPGVRERVAARKTAAAGKSSQ